MLTSAQVVGLESHKLCEVIGQTVRAQEELSLRDNELEGLLLVESIRLLGGRGLRGFMQLPNCALNTDGRRKGAILCRADQPDVDAWLIIGIRPVLEWGRPI